MTQAIVQRKPATSSGFVLMAAAAAVIGAAPLFLQRYIGLDPAMIATLGYPAIFLANVIGSITLFLPVPGLAVVFAGGSVLHPVPVAVVGAAGMASGMVASYILGYTGNSLFKKAAISKSNLVINVAAKVGDWFKRFGVLAAFLLAAVPNPFFDFAGLIAGAIRMPLWKFLLGTFLGKVVQALVVALAGAYAASWFVTFS